MTGEQFRALFDVIVAAFVFGLGLRALSCLFKAAEEDQPLRQRVKEISKGLLAWFCAWFVYAMGRL